MEGMTDDGRRTARVLGLVLAATPLAWAGIVAVAWRVVTGG